MENRDWGTTKAYQPRALHDAYTATCLKTCQRRDFIVARQRGITKKTSSSVLTSLAAVVGKISSQSWSSFPSHTSSSVPPYLEIALINPRHQAQSTHIHHQPQKPKTTKYPSPSPHHGRQSRHQPLPLHHPHRARIPPRLRCRQPTPIPIHNGPTTRT